MCVAVLVESTKGPTTLELFQMEDANPHGAGVAWAVGDLIRYKKGLTYKQVAELLERIPRPALVHFRWATHGGCARYLTHPFPLGPRAVTSRKLNSAAPAVLIHNGVWTGYEQFAPLGVDLNKWSDTAVAAYAAGVIGEEILDHVDWSTAVGRASGNNRMDVSLRGHWVEYRGNLYSNLQWRRDWYKPHSGFNSWRGGWDDGTDWPEELADVPLLLGEPQEDTQITAQPTQGEFRWNAEGQLVRANVVRPEDPISTWLDEEFGAVQRALAGDDE